MLGDITFCNTGVSECTTSYITSRKYNSAGFTRYRINIVNLCTSLYTIQLSTICSNITPVYSSSYGDITSYRLRAASKRTNTRDVVRIINSDTTILNTFSATITSY